MTEREIYSIVSQNYDAVYKQLFNFTLGHLEGILKSCTRGCDPKQIPVVAREIAETSFERFKDRMACIFLILKAYDLLRLEKARSGINLPEIYCRHARDWSNYSEELAMNYLVDTDYNHLEKILRQAIEDAWWDREVMDKILGRFVWDCFWQVHRKRLPEGCSITFY